MTQVFAHRSLGLFGPRRYPDGPLLMVGVSGCKSLASPWMTFPGVQDSASSRCPTFGRPGQSPAPPPPLPL